MVAKRAPRQKLHRSKSTVESLRSVLLQASSLPAGLVFLGLGFFFGKPWLVVLGAAVLHCPEAYATLISKIRNVLLPRGTVGARGEKVIPWFFCDAVRSMTLGCMCFSREQREEVVEGLRCRFLPRSCSKLRAFSFSEETEDQVCRAQPAAKNTVESCDAAKPSPKARTVRFAVVNSVVEEEPKHPHNPQPRTVSCEEQEPETEVTESLMPSFEPLLKNNIFSACTCGSALSTDDLPAGPSCCGDDSVRSNGARSSEVAVDHCEVTVAPRSDAGTVYAVAGAAVLGTVGGTAGMVAGGVVGGVAGLVPSLLTFGLSVPVFAFAGSAIGLVAGSASAAVGGFIGGRALGNSIPHSVSKATN